MREFVLALRAIWASWQDGSRLDFRGEFYQHTLMTPMFSPPPNPWGPPPVLLAAVGPRMTTVAAEVADGMLVHGFTTERYLREITRPLIHDGLHASGRGRDRFTICYPGLLATGDTDADLETAVTAVRGQLAFYGATPAYRPVLDLHGWGDLHTDLHQLSVRGDWAAMTGLIDDTVLHTFAVVGHAGPASGRRSTAASATSSTATPSTPPTPCPNRHGSASSLACTTHPARRARPRRPTRPPLTTCPACTPRRPDGLLHRRRAPRAAAGGRRDRRPSSATTTTPAKPRPASSPANCGRHSASTATSASTSPRTTAAAGRAWSSSPSSARRPRRRAARCCCCWSPAPSAAR